ncbi:MAG: hypothetical protein GTO13_10610 [Proteobacteria bacterium]|nr:hypothetical protein [Pseudomonadota bacterium]
MDCHEVQDQLIEFYENQLHGRDAEHIRDHLEICPLCGEELRSIEKVIVRLQSQRLRDPGEIFWRDFPARVRKAFYEGDIHIRISMLARVWERIYGFTTGLPFSKPVYAAVSIAMLVLIIGGLLSLKTGWFWMGSRGIGEEIVEVYPDGMEVLVSPFTDGSLEGLSLYQLEDISKGLRGWLNGMGSSVEEVLKGDRFAQGEDVFAQLEELSSEELDFVSDALKTRYLKSSTSLHPNSLGGRKSWEGRIWYEV